MSDIVRKMVTISDVQESSNSSKERRFKKTVSLKLKIGSNGYNSNSPMTPTTTAPKSK